MSISEKIMEGQMMQNIKNKIPGIFIALILAVPAWLIGKDVPIILLRKVKRFL